MEQRKEHKDQETQLKELNGKLKDVPSKKEMQLPQNLELLRIKFMDSKLLLAG
jgi:hypothetical protein